MKNLLSALLLLFLSSALFAQQWNFQGGGGPADDAVQSMCKDDSGNIYIAGTFRYSLQMGSQSYVSHGGNDCFIAKYDSNSVLTWVKTWGGNDDDVCFDIEWSNGKLYAAGSFKSDELFLDQLSISSYHPGSNDSYITALDSSGNFEWAYRFGSDSTSNDFVSDIKVTDNAIYAAGLFEGNFSAGNGINTSSTGLSDGYLIKFDLNCSAIWGRYAQGTTREFCRLITTDDAENIYVAGPFGYQSATLNQTMYFGNDTLNSFQGSGYSDIFLAKLDSSGSLLYLIREGGFNSDTPSSLYCEGNRILMGGVYTNEITLGGTVYSTNYGSDGFIIAYDTSLTPQWSHVFYSISALNPAENIIAINGDEQGNFYALGFYRPNYYGITKINSAGTILYTDTLFTNYQGSEEADIEIKGSCNKIYVAATYSTYLTDKIDTLQGNNDYDLFLATRTDQVNVLITPQNIQSNTADTLCANANDFNVSVDAVNGALGYIWIVEPSFAATITGSGTSVNVNIDSLYNGEIKIYAKASSACYTSDASDTLHVFVKMVTPAPQIIQSGMTLTADLFADSYIWLYNGNVLPNDTVISLDVTVVGTYQVATVINGCISGFSLPVTILSVGANELNIREAKTFYPNPSSDFISFRNVSSFSTIKISDINGRVLLKQKNINNKADLRILAKGIYILSIIDDKSINNFRLVKQ